MAIQKGSLAAAEHDWFATRSGLAVKLEDSSNNANAGTLAGGAKFQESPTGGEALFLEGTNSYVDMGDVSALDTGFTSLTLSAWVYVDTAQAGENQIISKFYDAYELGLIPLRIKGELQTDTGQVTYYATNDTAGKVDLNTWTHVAMVYDGANVHFYKNGVECSLSAYAKTGTVSVNASSFTIGARPGPSGYYRGLIKNARVYSRALTAVELLAETNGTDPDKTGLVAEYRCKSLLTNIPLNDHKAAYFASKGFGSNASIIKTVNQMESEWLSNVTGVNGSHNAPDQWREAVAKAGLSPSADINENRRKFFENVTTNP
jgi:hypothetical protein